MKNADGADIDPTAQNYTAPTIAIKANGNNNFSEGENVNLSGALSAVTGGDKVGAFLVYLTHTGNGSLKEYLIDHKLIEADGSPNIQLIDIVDGV